MGTIAQPQPHSASAKGKTTSPVNVARLRTDAPRAGARADRETIAYDLPLEDLRHHAMTPAEGAPWVLGADVCRGSWAGIMWDGITIKGLFASTIAELVETAHAVGVVCVVAIDIPIGLPAPTRVRPTRRRGPSSGHAGRPCFPPPGLLQGDEPRR